MTLIRASIGSVSKQLLQQQQTRWQPAVARTSTLIPQLSNVTFARTFSAVSFSNNSSSLISQVSRRTPATATAAVATTKVTPVSPNVTKHASLSTTAASYKVIGVRTGRRNKTAKYRGMLKAKRRRLRAGKPTPPPPRKIRISKI